MARQLASHCVLRFALWDMDSKTGERMVRRKIMRISEAVRGYLLAKTADGYSPHTLALYRNMLKLFIEHVSDLELGDVTPACVQGFAAWLRGGYVPHRFSGETKPYAMSSFYNAWCSQRSFWKWAAQELGVKRPDLIWHRPCFKRPETMPLSQDEVSRLLHAAEHSRPASTERRRTFQMRRPTAARDRALLLLLLDTGLRVSECARLRVRDVNLETGEVYVQPWGTGRKTKSRHVYLGNASRKAIWKYLSQRETHADDLLFLTDEGRPMDRNSIRLLLAHMGKRAGVSNVHPHRLRHTFAITFLRNGDDVFSLQRLLGHATLDMVKNYLALADSDSATAHRQASPCDRWHL